MPPQSQAETATMRAAQSLAESTSAAPKDLLTLAERTKYKETGSYDEAVAFYRRLEKLSPLARLVPTGLSGEGRMLYALIVSKDKAFTPEAARRTGKPVVLLQNGIHAGENGGKDAAMMLLRDVLVTKRHAAWLDHAILLSIVVFNADGHEHTSGYNRINENGPAKMGFRVNASRLNLNRDYLKADTPEMRAWLKLYTAWLPDFLIDNHVTDGSDNQYDVTIATHTEQDIASEVGGWVAKKYLPRILPEMEKRGHVVGWYIEGRSRDGDSLAVMTASPRYSTGYAAAQNRAALLVETHSLKSFKTRVWSHYDIMAVTLDAVSAEASALRTASVAADRRYQSMKAGEKVFLAGNPGDESEPYVQHLLAFERPFSPISGGPVARYSGKTVDQPVRLVRGLVEKVVPQAPAGYLVPRQWSKIIELLRIHGVKLQTINKSLNRDMTMWKLENARWATVPFEGRFQVVSFIPREVKQSVDIPAGSVFVPVGQRAFKVAMQILEPAAPDSAVRWGYFQSIFEQKEYFSDYVFEPYAKKMLEADPALKAEFEKKIHTEAAFAKNPRARLTWLYQRSPYFEPDKDVYPVIRVTPEELGSIR